MNKLDKETKVKVGTQRLCTLLGVTDRTVRRWTAAGIITPVEKHNSKLYVWDVRQVLKSLHATGRFTHLTYSKVVGR